jgi:hypothetical protein
VSSPCDEALSRRHTVVAVLRLVVAGRDELDHGEIVTPDGQVAARFRTWDALVPEVRGWLARSQHGHGPAVTEPGGRP